MRLSFVLPFCAILLTFACGDDDRLLSDGGQADDMGWVDAQLADARLADAQLADVPRLDVGSPDAMMPGPQCGRLTCNGCSVDPSCGFCASSQACEQIESACSWHGPTPASCDGTVRPCTGSRCWNPDAGLTMCGNWDINEDFSSGNYDMHRFALSANGGGPITIRLERTAGTLAPMLFITTEMGNPIWLGDGGLHDDVAVTGPTSGRTGDFAEVTIELSASTRLSVYVSGWATADSGFADGPGMDVTYTLSMSQGCGSMPPAGDLHAGITQSGSEIPREGLRNPTLEGALGVAVEPYGTVVSSGGQQWVRGTVSHFGGPEDRDVSADETGAITGENLRSLNTPLSPTPAQIAADPGAFYYVAMRFNYSPGGRAFWRNARILVRNPETDTQIVVRAVDWGPNTSAGMGRILDLSPQSLIDLGLTTDENALVAFAREGAPLGFVH